MAHLNGRVLAIIGYGAQGSAQAQCLRDSGVNVIIGSRPGKSAEKAAADGFTVMSISDAVRAADIVHILLPDEVHAAVYAAEIGPNLRAGQALCCSHGFNLVYKQIVPPGDIDVIMVAPKGVAAAVRNAYLAGSGVAGLFSVRQDFTGNARNIALAIAKAMGYTRIGVAECTFEQETVQDIFGEQNVLCGGMVDLMKNAFEVLTEKGYPPELAYFEVVYEVKLIVDLIMANGFTRMHEMISNTAEFGEYYNGPQIITPDVKQRMRESLERIENGEFAAEFMKQAAAGHPVITEKRAEFADSLLEKTSAAIRALYQK